MIAAHAQDVSSIARPDSGLLDTVRLHTAGISAGAIHWLRQAICGLAGHSMLMHFESTRLSLQCMSCGHTTPGWALNNRH
jgi:hypothetical protein